MMMQIDRKLCAGCGTCVDTCPVGAIQLQDGCATIDEAICTGCETCKSVCPNGAISISPLLEPSVPVTTSLAAASYLNGAQEHISPQEPPDLFLGLAPIAGATLTFLGREVAPRLVDVLFTVLERRLTRSVTPQASQASNASKQPSRISRGLQRKVRFRGGRTEEDLL
jgi:ferredoxin